MGLATIQLILGVLDVWLPLLCMLLVALALFLLSLHWQATRSSRAAFEERALHGLPRRGFSIEWAFVSRSFRDSDGTTSRQPSNGRSGRVACRSADPRS
ncbi:MAG: hypothetical protein IT169_08435 [Bryobacterales bacterium]|nr:hypothetical protein [Bryobacterales bacterium]